MQHLLLQLRWRYVGTASPHIPFHLHTETQNPRKSKIVFILLTLRVNRLQGQLWCQPAHLLGDRWCECHLRPVPGRRGDVVDTVQIGHGRGYLRIQCRRPLG